MNYIILFLFQYINYLHQTIFELLNFIAKYIPIKQWAFDELHSPKYQKFKVDELPIIINLKQDWNYKDLIAYYKSRYNKAILPVNRRKTSDICDDCICPRCQAPKPYLYENNGKKDNIEKSQIVAIVGPTGSGKSRLLADIEWTANKDTPTGRSILISDELPDKKWRFSSNNKLVAQLSQNMNFVMDLCVKEFVELHAQSRLVEDIEAVVDRIIEEANKLAGESFLPEKPITSLSGGQSRALMIADTAILSSSPIVLIDEIENAGIDRKKALKLLVSEDKIVLMATHDPLLALMADKRIVTQTVGSARSWKPQKKKKEGSLNSKKWTNRFRRSEEN